jgi:hypothetical protein
MSALPVTIATATDTPAVYVSDSHQSNNEQHYPTVTAGPVEQNPPTISPTVAFAQEIPMTSTGLYENERFGICRRCRRQFERPPGVHDGQAQYYRCKECDGVRLQEMIIDSCIIQ